MDDRRFDLIAKVLGTSTARRGAFGVLAALGLLAGDLDRAEAKRKKGKKGRKRKNKNKNKSRKPRPLCPVDALDRCAEPVLETLVASSASCQAGCADPASAACRACLDPAVDQATRDIAACLEQTCRGGTGPTEAGGEARAETARAARAVAAQAAACNSAAYDTCVARNNRDLATCLAKELLACDNPRSCIVDLGGCIVESRNRASDCIADHGCKGGGYCKQNVCCPHWADTVCNGACCATSKCETCENGVCKSCGKDQVCTVSPAQVRTCRCLRNLAECGDQCCDPRQCEACAFVDGVGTCFSECLPPKICKRGTFSGSCECPPDMAECGDGCCRPNDCKGEPNGTACKDPADSFPDFDGLCIDESCCLGAGPCGWETDANGFSRPTICCGSEERCIDSTECCPRSQEVCETKCCASGEECVYPVDGPPECCPRHRVVGRQCCPESLLCGDVTLQDPYRIPVCLNGDYANHHCCDGNPCHNSKKCCGKACCGMGYHCCDDGLCEFFAEYCEAYH